MEPEDSSQPERYQKKGDIAKARADYEKALALDPDADVRKAVQAALDGLPPADPTVISDPTVFSKGGPLPAIPSVIPAPQP